jgi:hypothetical protein
MFRTIQTKKRKTSTSNYDMRVLANGKLEFSEEFFNKASLNERALNFGQMEDGRYGFQVVPNGEGDFFNSSTRGNKGRTFSNHTVQEYLTGFVDVKEFYLNEGGDNLYIISVAPANAEEYFMETPQVDNGSLNQEQPFTESYVQF